MERYPLSISVPRAETVRQWMDRHSTYAIEVDDCGKIYSCSRRYANFAWLHAELRGRGLACALPELPPKRAVGRLKEPFVEKRRRMLEDYLRALLRLPAVIQDDSVWTFLDADIATAVVPRFLCRPQAPSAAGEILRQLEQVASEGSSAFRLCSPAVLGELVALVKAEAAEGAAPAAQAAPGQQRELQARLNNRLRLCRVLQLLTRHERARQGLVDAGAFSSLLALLRRAHEDALPASAGGGAADARRAAPAVLADCLRGFLESTRGAVMLQFCQQDSGFGALQPLSAPEAPALHAVCASLLWHGFQHPGVVQAFASSAASGLRLLGRLLQSPDPCAGLLAGLCVGCVVRGEGALEEETRNFCLEALEPVAARLDKAEEEALERAAAKGVFQSPPECWSRQVDREPTIVALLRTLCSKKELPRLQTLLAGPSQVEACVDSVAALSAAVLDHFVRQCEHQPERRAVLSPLAPLLQQLLDGSERTGSTTEEGSRAASDLAVRASRVLLHLEWPVGPKALGAFTQRLSMLGALSRDSEECHSRASGRMAAAQSQNRQQAEDVRALGLTDQLCFGQQQLADFGAHLSQLEQNRATLEGALNSLNEERSTVRVSLDRHGVKHTILREEVKEFQRRLESKRELETRSSQAQCQERACEDSAREAQEQLESLSAQAREVEAAAREKASGANREEARACLLAGRAAELAEICHNAPAQLERLRSRLEEATRQRAGLVEQGLRLGSEVDRKEREATALRESEREARAALESLAVVRAELREFGGTLQSELVLAEREVERLRQMELRLQPGRPSRLRRDPDLLEAQAQADLPEGPSGPPAWDAAARAEQEFRAEPQLRTFSRLCAERERLWSEELRWLRELASASEAEAAGLSRQRREAEEGQIAGLQREERQLRHDIAELSDLEGHALRHQEACAAASEARESSQAAAIEASEVAGSQKLVETRLERAREQAQRAVEAQAAARDASGRERDLLSRACAELQQQCLELEGGFRACIGEWRSVELEERRMNLLHGQVEKRMQEEGQERTALRAEVRKLVEMLQELDRQLQAAE